MNHNLQHSWKTYCNLTTMFAVTSVVLCSCGGSSGPDGENGQPGKGSGTKAPPFAIITGTVVYQGKPVSGGTVQIHYAEDKAIATTGLDNQGRFYLSNLRPGKVILTVETESAKQKYLALPYPESDDAFKAKQKKILASLPDATTTYLAIPKKYGSLATSGLAQELHYGKNNIHLKLN